MVNSVYDTNEARAASVEEFLLQEAITAGVVKKIELRAHKNPNKWTKKLAPWFNEDCKGAKATWVQARRVHGRDSEEARSAAGAYRRACLAGKREFAQKVPDMLKYKPK